MRDGRSCSRKGLDPVLLLAEIEAQAHFTAEIVRMALEQVDWPLEDPRWFWMLWRPVPGHEDYTVSSGPSVASVFG